MREIKRSYLALRAGITVILTVIFGIISVGLVSGTTVSVNSPSTSISGNQDFTVNISCQPSQPVKAFEFRLSFNPLLMKAINVTEGNIFNGHSTFFSSGTINNISGSITNIYSVIVGAGNVTSNGTFVTITFTAKDNSGTSSLDLNDVGITDELGYITVNTTNTFVTIEGSGGGGGGSSPPTGGGNAPVPNANEPPDQPLKPTGPIFIEMGVDYEYTSVTEDPDGDGIRYRFDWGDGNMSNWSDFIESNTSMSTSHSWSFIDTFTLKVIAQDEDGFNSSWSLPLNVTVSQIVMVGDPPVANFVMPNNISVNKSIVFDGSLSFDEDGAIISYYWIFGDGNNGSGVSPSHLYEIPGDYLITLVVTDNNGNTCNKTIIINVSSGIEDNIFEDQLEILPIHIALVLIGGGGAIAFCLLYYFRDNIVISMRNIQRVPISHHVAQEPNNKKIRRIDAKIEKLRRKMEHY